LRAIGVDVGATRVRAARIRREPDGCLDLEALAQTPFPASGFVPLALSSQREGAPLPPAEVEEARRRCECIARTVAEVSDGGLPVGVAAPGVKSPDGRGIALARLGPRIPEMSAWLEAHLGVRLPPLGSDGVLAGVGEERASLGSFRGVTRAYYLAAGTGLAEAVKNGALIGAAANPPLYELRGRNGLPFEDLVSARVWPNPRLLEDLVDLLRARRESFDFQRVVLGGHLRSAVDPEAVGRAVGAEVVVSRLPYPAVFGAAALALGETGA